jgi:hypothetical protein
MHKKIKVKIIEKKINLNLKKREQTPKNYPTRVQNKIGDQTPQNMPQNKGFKLTVMKN